MNDTVYKLRKQEFLNKISLAIESLIKKRTAEGTDYTGASFKPYSEKYADKRRALSLPADKVNLSYDLYSGMMTSLDHVVLNNFESAKVYFNKTEKEKLAYYHNISGAGKKKVIREFFNLSGAEVNMIMKLAEQYSEDFAKITEEEILSMLSQLDGGK